MIRVRRSVALAGALAAAIIVTASAPSRAVAQQRKAAPRPTTTIVIHGQVPTPQVVTVRPREVPSYDPRALGPGAAAPSLWPSILPGYRLVAEHQVTGRAAHDSTLVTLAPMAPPPAGSPPAVAAAPPRDTMSTAARTAAIDSMRSEIVRRRAHLDSLERAMRGTAAEGQTVQNLDAPAAPTSGRSGRSAADSAARAARATEINALFLELERRRARLDSLEAVVRTLGRPRAAPDTTRALPSDSTHTPH